MASIDEIRNTRLEKLKKLESNGISPFPVGSEQDYYLIDVVSNFTKLTKQKKPLFLVGRVMALRPQGAIVFFNFFDGTAKFQGFIKKGEKISDPDFDLFVDTVDVGDFIEVKGNLFVTKRNEKTLQV